MVSKEISMTVNVEVDMCFNFGLALEYLKKGFKVTKKSWHKEGMYLELQNPTELSKMTASYVYITIDNDYRIPWHPSQADMLEEDWQVIK